MKYLLRIIPLIIFSVIISSCSDQVTGINNTQDSPELTKSVLLVPGELSPEEAAGLIYMRQEEKVARDVYIVLGQQWNLNIFTKIASSEQKHMDAVGRLIDKYELEDPVINDEVGVFADPDFQQMYNDFVLLGLQSIQDAMSAGQTIEIQDIEDLEAQLAFVDNQDIIKVYSNLLAGSQKHLSAFSAHTLPVF